VRRTTTGEGGAKHGTGGTKVLGESRPSILKEVKMAGTDSKRTSKEKKHRRNRESHLKESEHQREGGEKRKQKVRVQEGPIRGAKDKVLVSGCPSSRRPINGRGEGGSEVNLHDLVVSAPNQAP